MAFNPKNVFDLPDLDVPIYRIFPVDRFRQVMEGRKLALVRPASWEDKFENVLLKSKASINTKEIVGLCDLREKMYGQCWMLCPDSEAMWKLYSFPSELPSRWFHRAVYKVNRWLNGLPHKQEGVKVRTTPRKLFTAFFKDSEQYCDLCYFIGRVRYMPQQDIESMLKDEDQVTSLVLDSTGRGHAQSLLFKRDSFSHEQEVRLIYAANDGSFDPNRALYLSDVAPNSLFEEVSLDPRLATVERDDSIARIRSWGYQGPINQSTLNIPPHFTVDLDA
ncbi:DUF2971 domain-containing protein [Telmatocola sphagniphila]|uniref:DUF2971 domain-containing protein n=1 Tax=Telmatocola sphagniphila TaxID=1123043 RepID=A0A8E6B4M0_9BACT|nr:hypothetical protein [Telmatocola sphagniphila]QVL30290.1 DUF2971 domain-containing protein [Telmatocola sphagniphila]